MNWAHLPKAHQLIGGEHTMKDRHEKPAWLKTQKRVDAHGIYRLRDTGGVPSEGILRRLSVIRLTLKRYTVC